MNYGRDGKIIGYLLPKGLGTIKAAESSEHGIRPAKYRIEELNSASSGGIGVRCNQRTKYSCVLAIQPWHNTSFLEITKSSIHNAQKRFYNLS